MKLRTIAEGDYEKIKPLINHWWGGREMAHLLPKLFFTHFNNTSFIIEKDRQVVGFLIGFLSQTNLSEAYIHFVGVHPEYRNQNIARGLYQAFFDQIIDFGRTNVKCITSPVNKTSIAFHTKMGFSIEDGDSEVNGIAVSKDYDGPGQDRVLFVINL
ncbi:GNAT family N-acetyltransferase [Halalkalibacter akibai]|uniref:Acetyltransferase n=1 Tax=Halalkalibacter akibai (strain ATCC 43226 / DSM 21942 / CIP 109018 / JCM 9157 / 1139) TaxID=1236973 RepID=W4QVT0_HALA3|nr:GNAT family N-acetyltransferase [Halalkalibacter akibai]GAE35743.1 acetyltransferase [Halalkalibacter akibai JCM 9157]